MAFSADTRQVEALYMAHAPQLFALCYLHAGGPKGAATLLHTLLCDLLLSPRAWRLASSGAPGLFRCAQEICLEQYYRRAKRPKKNSPNSPPAPRTALPFTMTDALRAILDLPAQYKAPLYLRLALGWSAEDAAAAVGGSPQRVDRLAAKALKKTKLTQERARQALLSVAPAPTGPQELWDGFLVDQADKGFLGKQRLRRFKRWLDHAIPYIALGVIVFCVLAYQGVEQGWFTGQPYEPAVPMESQIPGDYAMGTAAIFSVDGDDFIQYNVTDCPLDPETLVRQMVALGGAPEGTYVLSARRDTPSRLTLELSREAAQWFASAPPAEQEAMLAAMAGTLGAAYPDLAELRLTSGGEELTARGKTAQDWLGPGIQPVRTVTTPYRE